MSRDPDRLRSFVAQHGDTVLKPLDGMGGSSIFRVRADDPNLNVIIETLKIYKDSTYAMMVEAARRGHALFVCGPQDLTLESERVVAWAWPLRLLPEFIEDRHRSGVWWKTDAANQQPLSTFDAVLIRKYPPFDLQYIYATYLLEHAQRLGARVFNDPRAIRDHN